MAKTFNQFKKKIDELYLPKAGDEAKFMAMHGPYTPADVGGPETHNDAIFNGTIVQKDHTKLAPDSESLPDGQSELKDLIKNIHSRETDELLKTVAHLNLSTDPKHRESRDVINKELMYRYKNHSMSEELIGGQKNLDVHPTGRPDGRLTAKDFAILRARKNKKKMNEDMGTPHGFVPKSDREAFGSHMAKAGLATAIQSDEPARDYSASANPKHGATKTHAAVRINTPAAKEHAKKFPGFTTSVNEDEELDEISDTLARNYERKADAQRRKLSNPYGHSPEDANTLRKRGEGKVSLVARRFTKVLGKNQANEESELDEGKFGNAMDKFTGKSKSPFVSKLIHGFETGQAARAAKKSKADPDNFDKLMNYANARNKVREETNVEEGVSVNGVPVGGYRGNRSPLSRIQKTPAEIARHKAGFDAVTKIIDKMNAPGGIKSPERSAEIDADLKKKRNAELTAAGRKPLPETSHKSRKIAGAIMRNEDVNFNTEEIELEDGNVIEIDIELAEAIADLFDSLDEDEQDVLAEMLHSDIDSFMEVVGLLEDDGE
jgi:hypothetical protein